MHIPIYTYTCTYTSLTRASKYPYLSIYTYLSLPICLYLSSFEEVYLCLSIKIYKSGATGQIVEHICVYAIPVYAYTCVYICMHMYVCICMYVYVRYVHVYVYICICIYVCTYMYVYAIQI